MVKTKTIFDRLRKGQQVRDIWYGPGKVVRVTQRRAYIKMLLGTISSDPDEVVAYDRAHVNEFILIGRKG